MINTHGYCYFAIKGEMWFLTKNSFISQNHWSLTETKEIGIEKNLWNFELDPITFLDFTDIWVKNTKKWEWMVQHFFEEYTYIQQHKLRAAF